MADAKPSRPGNTAKSGESGKSSQGPSLAAHESGNYKTVEMHGKKMKVVEHKTKDGTVVHSIVGHAK